ncbi:MAG: NYN domain-containing protein [Candidatus Alcyoniella australis]|nr:NYN domain-containing protein [Candidatus Alcyoniella australis]
MSERERDLAVFIDFENLALGFKNRNGKQFEIQKVLERLVDKGKIIVKKAYADWSRYASYKRELHEAAIELIEIPRRSMTGKNSADIRLCVDAMDLCYSKEHVDTFVIVSGDSDFSPLVSKLKENGKHVIGLGMKESSSDLLVGNCDEFIYYDDLMMPQIAAPKIDPALPKKKQEAFQLLLEAVIALVRENKDVLYSSMVKDTMKRKRPSFNETYHGYRSFQDLLEDARENNLIKLHTDSRSGTYVVTGFGQMEQSNGSSPSRR